MLGVFGHFSQHHCQWSLPRVSMWFYLNLNFSTFKLGQADLTIIVIEVTQIQTLSAPTRAPGADSLKEKCPLALLPLLTCIVEHDINCSSYWNKVGNGGVQSVISDWRDAIQCKYLQSPELTKTTYESHYIFPLIIKFCDSKLICQCSSTWCQLQLCTHPQEWEQEAEAGQEDAVEAVAPPGGGQRGAAHIDDEAAAVARAGHAQPVTLLAHTVLGQPWLPGGSHYVLTTLNCI